MVGAVFCNVFGFLLIMVHSFAGRPGRYSHCWLSVEVLIVTTGTSVNLDRKLESRNNQLTNYLE